MLGGSAKGRVLKLDEGRVGREVRESFPEEFMPELEL